MRRPAFLVRVVPLLIVPVLLSACPEQEQGRDYYSRVIQPILTTTCNGTSGCHRADPADPLSFAAGNLDLTSFENVHKRPDLLRTYGPYPVPMMLIKAVGATDELQIAYRDDFLPVEIQHAGGAIFGVGSPAFLTLQTWLENGATRDGLPPAPGPVEGQAGCSHGLPPDFDPASVTADPAWTVPVMSADGATNLGPANQYFRDTVMPLISMRGCNAGNCHGAPQSDFYITCGEATTPGEVEFNFRQMWSFVDDPVDDSDLLRRPLALGAGGLAHTGGVHWGSRDDSAYQAIALWAQAVKQIEFGVGDAPKTFFADHVMPVFLKRGCSAEGCHSPAAMNDFKLRAGSQGFFSAISLERNYELARAEFMALETPDVRRGRLVAKTILPIFGGINHRGGPVLETPGSGGTDPVNCPAVYDPAGPAFCTFVEWARIEREELLAAGAIDPLGAGATVPIVYVERQASHVASPLEFDVYQPNSDLLVADATLDAAAAITGVGAPRSLLDSCPGAASRAVVDVRAPDVRFDGVTVTFAMRTSAGEGLGVYKVALDGTGCVRLSAAGAGHAFDPAWSPDGEWIVYASTQQGGMTGRGHPQSDLWRMRADGTGAERVTFLSNSELGPQMMREGRITMTTEKADPADAAGFYQLAGRRLNWDLTDYHPLLAQRAQSPFADGADPAALAPSIGFQQATDIREVFDGNFYLVLSDEGARGGGGTLAIMNRSVGPMELGRSDPGYMGSLTLPDPAATGRGATQGAYRAPSQLLDGQVMASYAGGSFDLMTTGTMDYDLVAVDPQTGARTTLIGGGGAQVDAVLALKYPAHKPYLNRRQLVFGQGVPNGAADATHAVVHFPDAPMLATLLDSNLRRGRPVARYRDADTLAILLANGSTLGTASLADDGSARIRVPAQTPVVIQLRNGGTPLFTMTEEHQFGPGENISLGVPEALFDHICAGCHGAVSGREVDAAVTADALTGASISQSAAITPVNIGN